MHEKVGCASSAVALIAFLPSPEQLDHAHLSRRQAAASAPSVLFGSPRLLLLSQLFSLLRTHAGRDALPALRTPPPSLR
ncbi:hypothetical protein TYRP_011304 [Tyrophagus putrescentiae]|nr:hypothetical protein TYRP_011304 [Tyrophagus putrescentiae]